MRLLMESAPREHEKRTLSANLECRGVCVYVSVHELALESPREANAKPFYGTSHLKRGHVRCSSQGRVVR